MKRIGNHWNYQFWQDLSSLRKGMQKRIKQKAIGDTIASMEENENKQPMIKCLYLSLIPIRIAAKRNDPNIFVCTRSPKYLTTFFDCLQSVS